MLNPLVSVIMGTYNETESMLRESIESILKQTYSNIEFIIVIDNPSNENLKNIIKEYTVDNRIIVIENEENIGLRNSLNKGIKQSKGKYICRMDADDISLPERIAIEVEYMENHPECSLVYTARINIDEDGNRLNTRQAYPRSDEAIKKCLNYDTPITHPTVLMKADVVKQLGCYRCFYVAEDLDLWRRIRNKGGNFHFINQPLLCYRCRENSVSAERKIMEPLTRFWQIKNEKNSNMDDYGQYINYRTSDIAFVNCYLTYYKSIKNKRIFPVIKSCLKYEEFRADLYTKIGFKRMVVMK